MRKLPIVFAALLLAGCAGTHGAAYSGGAGGMGYGNSPAAGPSFNPSFNSRDGWFNPYVGA
ncbi:MAG TPA: hypothetical protein VEC01_15610 [Noviherbaspirillum sp.]|uniref:hypothetical protein n=1 Tax=Noviherbaspirillum sp. TaxID=1926288 RepID=UPI002D28AEAB|nr:hypothetical protein [Noviherbaspirillum sp.]HYD96755.1 hypothetical protein [Noviherbaspirillum sp.]